MTPDDPSSGERDMQTMRDVSSTAAERLGEQPDPRVRATVLAAAARAVDAKPRDAAHAPFGSRRWPLSIAAALIVAVGAGLVATHALRDDPDRVTTVAAPDPSAPSAAPAAKVAIDEPAVLPIAPATAPAAEPATVASRATRTRPETNVAAPARAKTHAAQLAPMDPSPDVPARVLVAPPPRPAEVASAPAAATAPAPAQSDAAANASAEGRARSEMQRFAPDTQPTVSSAALRRLQLPEQPTPQAWVDRIVKLRADGKDTEADRELDALRRRYPDFAIPLAALGTTGVR